MNFTGKNSSGDEYEFEECMENHKEIISLRIFIDISEDQIDSLASEIRTLSFPGNLDDGEFGDVLCKAFPKLGTLIIDPPGLSVSGHKEIKKLTNARVDKLWPA